jgi:hypothetical protein
MPSVAHAAVGAAIGAVFAVLPDIVLATFYAHHAWLPESSPLVRAHRYLHSAEGMWVMVAVIGASAWVSHVVIDWYSAHRTHP